MSKSDTVLAILVVLILFAVVFQWIQQSTGKIDLPAAAKNIEEAKKKPRQKIREFTFFSLLPGAMFAAILRRRFCRIPV